ncbi:MAG: hypothetical protein ACREAS_09155 [Nitrososphaera sp.]
MAYRKQSLQPYPREPSGYLAKSDLLPTLNPPLSTKIVRDAIKRAFERTKKNQKGDEVELHNTPEKLVRACLKHLKERNDPVMGTLFFLG